MGQSLSPHPSSTSKPPSRLQLGGAFPFLWEIRPFCPCLTAPGHTTRRSLVWGSWDAPGSGQPGSAASRAPWCQGQQPSTRSPSVGLSLVFINGGEGKILLFPCLSSRQLPACCAANSPMGGSCFQNIPGAEGWGLVAVVSFLKQNSVPPVVKLDVSAPPKPELAGAPWPPQSSPLLGRPCPQAFSIVPQ